MSAPQKESPKATAQELYIELAQKIYIQLAV